VWQWQRARSGGGHDGRTLRKLSKSEEGDGEDRREHEGEWEASGGALVLHNVNWEIAAWRQGGHAAPMHGDRVGVRSTRSRQ
jgi:ribosomal protein L4